MYVSNKGSDARSSVGDQSLGQLMTTTGDGTLAVHKQGAAGRFAPLRSSDSGISSESDSSVSGGVGLPS